VSCAARRVFVWTVLIFVGLPDGADAPPTRPRPPGRHLLVRRRGPPGRLEGGETRRLADTRDMDDFALQEKPTTTTFLSSRCSPGQRTSRVHCGATRTAATATMAGILSSGVRLQTPHRGPQSSEAVRSGSAAHGPNRHSMRVME
jgi:hypothetical protein